jgi:hypothetical protein
MGGWQTGGDVFSNVNGVYGTWGHLTGIGDDPVGSAFGLGADFIGFAQTFGSAAAPLFEATKFAEAAATPIINAGLLALLGMSNLSGFGTPDEGQDFSSGAEAFQQIGETLATTGAPGSWTGDGSEAYTDQNGLQEVRAKSMQQLDKSVGDVLAKEAGQVNETRQTIDYCSTTLTFAIPVAISLNAIPGYGQAASLEFQAAAVALSVPVAAARFLELTGQSAHNATIVRRAGAGYDGGRSGRPERVRRDVGRLGRPAAAVLPTGRGRDQHRVGGHEDSRDHPERRVQSRRGLCADQRGRDERGAVTWKRSHHDAGHVRCALVPA